MKRAPIPINWQCLPDDAHLLATYFKSGSFAAQRQFWWATGAYVTSTRLDNIAGAGKDALQAIRGYFS